MAQENQKRVETLHDSQVYRVSGRDDRPEGFYCTICHVHISTMDAAETHFESTVHQVNLQNSSNPSQGSASLSLEANEGPTVFQSYQLAHHEVKENQVIYQVTKRKAQPGSPC